MKKLLYIGNIGLDHVYWNHNGKESHGPGGAVYYGVGAAAKVANQNVDIELVTKVGSQEKTECLEKCLEELWMYGVKLNVHRVGRTHALKVTYPTANKAKRRIVQTGFCEPYQLGDMPQGFGAKYAHLICLAGNTDIEFPVSFIEDLANQGYQGRMAIDMQCLIRHVMRNGEIRNRDVPQKKHICNIVGTVKMDDAEANLLMGTKDMAEASSIAIKKWGCRRVIITSTPSNGVYVSVGKERYFARFSDGEHPGRNGRGDTTFAAGLVALEEGYNVRDSARFAAAVASIKLESPPGAFDSTFSQVIQRMRHIPAEPF